MISLDAYQQKVFTGKVSFVAPSAELVEKIKVFKVEVTLDELGDSFRTGMSANVEILGEKRDKAIVMPRQIAMFLMREETDVSLLRIGAELGGRDHSTVLHACDKITRESAVNDELRREIAAVRELIYAD